MMRTVTAAELRPFEGLVRSTARMFAQNVRREEEDLQQELRVVVWRAVGKHDPTRGYPLERWVFSAVANKMRDFKRDAAREANRRQKYGLTFLHIEGMVLPGRDPRRYDDDTDAYDGDAYDAISSIIEHDEIYRRVDEGKLVLPADVTAIEAKVLILLALDMTKPEIMLRLCLSRSRLDGHVASLREKFAEWRPAQRANSSRLVDLAA